MAAVSEPAVAVIGARVRALRDAQRLSLRDLAERSGVSAPMLSQVERGETSPTLQVAARIAEGLELRLAQVPGLHEDGTLTASRAPAGPRPPLQAAPAAARAAAAQGPFPALFPPPVPVLRAEVARHCRA